MLLSAASVAVLSAFSALHHPARPSLPACDLAERRAALFNRALVTENDGYMTASLSRLFADSGFVLSPGPITERGPSGVARVLGRDSLNATTKVRMTTIGGDVSVSGEDGFTYGYVDAVRANGDSLPGWYQAYWRRDKNGEWRILAMARRKRPPGAMSSTKEPMAGTSPKCREEMRVDTMATLKQIMATDLAFSDSAARSVSNAFATFAADDAAKSGAGAAYVYGQEAIRRLYDPPPPNGLKWWPELGTVANSGDLGFTVGGASGRTAPPPPSATAGHYFTIWRRDASGQWRFVID